MPSPNPQLCGSIQLLALPDDVLALISIHLNPKDLVSLSLTCHSLNSAIFSSEKAWLAQCHRIPGSPPLVILRTWRTAVKSYRSLCRFLAASAPLLGLWVHQNPELGNVVYVLWGFLSVIGVRIIPQEVSGRLLWAPVFEVVSDSDGANSCFFLHGRDRRDDCLYPGRVHSVDPNCNVLFLEVDCRDKDRVFQSTGSLQHTLSCSEVRELGTTARRRRNFCRSGTVVDNSRSLDLNLNFSFGRLAFGDRRRLLDLVAGRARVKVPSDLAVAPLFQCGSSLEDLNVLEERRLELISLHRLHSDRFDRKLVELELGSVHRRNAAANCELDSSCQREARSGKRAFSSVTEYLKDGFRQFIGRASSPSAAGLVSRNGGSLASGQSKHIQLSEFLKSGDTVGLSLRAAQMRLTTYRQWPNMHDNRFALYKLPLHVPLTGQEYAGLWGGSFGWPPGQVSEDKPAKALFLLLLSYEEVEGHCLLIATKILEGTHYVLHPNGSAMFIVKVDEPASEAFPWETSGESLRVEVKHSYSGEGIANGYGFRYPGSKPGSLFVLQHELLAFVWKETKSVLTLQRMNLEDLVTKGERVPTLPPIANFSYLTKSYSNVFAGLSNH